MLRDASFGLTSHKKIFTIITQNQKNKQIYFTNLTHTPTAHPFAP
ncbi:hypothetical protein [Moraxella lacunata]